MEKTRKQEGRRPRAWRVGQISSDFYALFVKRFSLPIRHVRGRGAWRSTPTFATVLRALTTHLFKAEKISVAF